MNLLTAARLAIPGLGLSVSLVDAAPREISGIYRHLAMFNDEGECGTGAVVPWADRLWAVTYAPHAPKGSSDKLYEITPGLDQIVRAESIGGTPANRMIHRESGQLFIGPYAIDGQRNVRVTPYSKMFGRPTGLARHLTDPAGKIVLATMEEGVYELDVKTLAVTELWADEQQKAGRKSDLPGYHGKGFYSAQGRYIYANNGDHASAALSDPTVPSGVLAEWDGKADRWNVVRRSQFTDVTGPGGIEGNAPGDDRVWSIGWDARSLILMLLEAGKWHAFRLPKASHSYDGAHGWNTEWPRIRDIGENDLLMTMHGCFWRFPKTFSTASTAGISPRSNYLKVVGDFCRWQNRIVLGCDDTAKSEFLNKHPLKGNLEGPGQSQSNLWFIDPARLDANGPSLGRGGPWLETDVKTGEPSDPYLFSGYPKRSLHLSHASAEAVTFTLEFDRAGNGRWEKFHDVTVKPGEAAWLGFESSESAAWIRLVPDRPVAKATAFFHYRGKDSRTGEASAIFAGIPRPSETKVGGGILRARGDNKRTLRYVPTDGPGYDLDGSLALQPANDAAGDDFTRKAAAIPPSLIQIDAASVLYVDQKGARWRLPKGDAAFDHDGPLGPDRVCREVCTERNLLNVHGTFYELPAQNAGGFAKVRPIATHNRRIHDFASYRGLLVISGLADDASGEHVVRNRDGNAALWLGAVDDLWSFGKPRGFGGPWKDTAVKAGTPSDPYLATGYDRKKAVFSHSGSGTVHFRIEADFSGNGAWSSFATVDVPAGKPVDFDFPDAFGAYWLRIVTDADTTATALFHYD